MPAHDLPRFPEEGVQDPFGQNARLLQSAAQRSTDLTYRIAEAAHARGTAMMLPARTHMVEFLWPWRSVVPCAPDNAAETLPVPAEGGASDTSADRSILVEELVQRAALTTSVLAADGASDVVDDLAELLESAGYVAVSRSWRERRLDAVRLMGKPLWFFSQIGYIAAKLYENNIIHGDMTSDNFLYDMNLKQVVISDVGTMCFLDRPITVEEHAADVGAMKLTCTFEEWEALKFGYRAVAPDRAQQLFQLV